MSWQTATTIFQVHLVTAVTAWIELILLFVSFKKINDLLQYFAKYSYITAMNKMYVKSFGPCGNPAL